METVHRQDQGRDLSCGRCDAEIDDRHYHCLNCTVGGGYNLCAKCADHGIYCAGSTHSWINRLQRDEVVVRRGKPISADDTRSMLPKFPGIFHPPGKSEDTPQALFRTEHRLIRAADSREILIYATGTCLSNGQDLPKAGCCFVYRSSAYTQRGDLTHGGTIRFRLEYKGPSGQHYRQTGNRAALRSVLAALQFRDWSKDCNESWRSIVIATDSKYVASNATERVKIWEGENWLTYDDELKCHVDIKNQDLWNSLMERIAELQSAGVRIRFWNITEDLNARTINFALQACSFHDEANFRVPSYFGPTGVLYMRNRI